MSPESNQKPTGSPVVPEIVSAHATSTPITRQKGTSNVNWPVMVSLMLLFLMSASSLGLSIASFAALSNNKNATQLINSGADGNLASFDNASIDSVVDKISPSVVSILTTTSTSRRNSSWFYGGSGESSGAGTGVIVSSDGYILTNKHVIDSAKKVSVVTDSGDTYDNVEIVAIDPLNDIAFLKIDGVSDLPVAEIGDSKTISVGQSVIAVGNALGQYQNTVTSGIISGTGRSVTASDSSGSSAETLTDMIQTDAAINLGNSGGPLVNAAGQVIGINTAVSIDGQSVGFAIPIGAAKGMLSSLLENGTAERAFIGVSYLPITSDIASEYDLSVKQGAYVHVDSGSAVRSGGPAAKAGIKDGDIILKVNGIDIGPKGSLALLTAEYSVGDVVEFTVLRGSKEITISVTLGAYSD